MRTNDKMIMTRRPLSPTKPVVKKKLKRVEKTPVVKTFRTAQIFSRHPSHRPLRRTIRTGRIKALVRFGSSTVPEGRYDVEINRPEAIANSASKLRMKRCFTKAGVKTAVWYTYDAGNWLTNGDRSKAVVGIGTLPFPIIAKHIFGSRGRGNYKLDSVEQLTAWLKGKNTSDYVFEKFHNYNREYRLHVTAAGCFYTCRKMLKNETPDDKRWFRNDSNSVWIVEKKEGKENPVFAKPSNWKEIEAECVKALKSCGLDFGAVDLRVQGKEAKGSPEFIIIEINSAPGLGEVGVEVYKTELLRLINSKYNG